MDSDGLEYDSDTPDTPQQPQKHHHSFLTELGHAAVDIGKGVATAGIAGALF